MKTRNGFVSNSSSSSFIITGEALEYFTTDKYDDYDDSWYGLSNTKPKEVSPPKDINDFCVKLTEQQKTLITEIPDDKKSLDWYMR